MTDRYRRVYALLVAQGHSPSKAIEIILNAMRGDEFSLLWIKSFRRLSKGKLQ